MTPEGKIKAKVNKLLKEPWLAEKLWYFMPVQRGFGKPALDYILCVNGWFVSIETKKNGVTPLTLRQQATKLSMEQASGVVFIIYDEVSLARCREQLVLLACANSGNYLAA